MRAFLSILALIAALVIALTQVWGELRIDPESGTNLIAPTAAKVQQIVRHQDKLLDLEYTKANREANFKRMGMPDELAASTVQAARRLEDAHRDKLKALLSSTGDPVSLGNALCGRTNQRRPRYAALAFLVEERKGERMVVNVARASSLKVQEWAVLSPIDKIYSKLELTDGRKDDATLMAIAGILAAQEETVLEGMKPWSDSVTGLRWSWSEVKKTYPTVEEKCIQYFALMHILVELAGEEGGLCEP